MDIKLNDSGDIDLGDNYTMKLCDKEEQLVKQRILITLGVNKGSYDFDINYGTPWVANDNNKVTILGKVPKVVYDGVIKQQIVSREGVKSLKSYNTVIDPTTRTATTKVEVETISGDIVTVSL
jgi:hypothetical protein